MNYEEEQNSKRMKYLDKILSGEWPWRPHFFAYYRKGKRYMEPGHKKYLPSEGGELNGSENDNGFRETPHETKRVV